MKKIVMLALVLVGTCFAAPQPAIVQSPDDWTLGVKYEHPQQLILQDSKGRELVYWYVILTISNETGRDVDFYPKCQILTDTFKLKGNLLGVSPVIFNAIRTRHNTKYPFLENLDTANHKILQGEDNIRDFAVIWPDFDADAKKASFFISGLSNETVAANHPTEKDPNGQPKKVYLRKTLQLDYSVGGNAPSRKDLRLKFLEQSWVMR